MQTVKVTRAPSHLAFNNGDGYDDVVGCYEYTATTVLGLLIGIFYESPVPRKRRPNCCFNPFFNTFLERISDVLPCSSSMLRLLSHFYAGG